MQNKTILTNNSNCYNPIIHYTSSINDYYSFGMLIDSRSYSSGTGYRYGFNGKYKDNEINGNGNQYDYGFRIYNPRLGKFLSVDPLTKSYPWYTPYQFAGNKPIWALDFDGLEEQYYQEELNNSFLFQLILEVSNSTTVSKKFNKVLLSQNKIDVYYYVLDNEMTYAGGLRADDFTVGADGHTGAGTYGETFMINNIKDLEKDGFVATNPSKSVLIDVNNLLNKGRKVLMIGIAKQFVNKELMPDIFYKKEENSFNNNYLNSENPNIKKEINPFTREIDYTVVKNYIGEGAHALCHEKGAHGTNKLNGIVKEAYDEHYEYSKLRDWSSPTYKETMESPSLKNSESYKNYKEIELILDKKYEKVSK